MSETTEARLAKAEERIKFIEEMLAEIRALWKRIEFIESILGKKARE